MPVPCLFVCNASYARTFFISSYANLFIYEQFNKFIKIQQVEIFLFFIIWGQPLLWDSQRSGWPHPRNAGFKPILWCGFWRLFQKVANFCVLCVIPSYALSYFSLFSLFSLFFSHRRGWPTSKPTIFFYLRHCFSSVDAFFHCVTVSYARNCFLCAFGYILVLIAILSVIIRA